MRTFAPIVVLASIFVLGPAVAAAPAPSAPLGSPEFLPTPERPVGWRGDGTGRYPGATPPTSWERKLNGNGYTTKNVLWATPLPNTSIASPIVVGSRVFVTSDFADLVCLDKQTGRLLWIRSNSDFEGQTDEERKAEPAYGEKLAPLAAQLEQANAEVVEALNALQADAPAAAVRPPAPALLKKRAIEKQIQDEQQAIDKKKYKRYWAQGVYGYSGPTPTSDGRRVFACFASNVVACYDLDGRRRWITLGTSVGWPEKGNFVSPLLCGNRLVVQANEMRGYDADTGKLLWANRADIETNGGLFRLQAGDEAVAAMQSGFFTRVRDGKAVWNAEAFGNGTPTPIVEGGVIYAWAGRPRLFNAFRIAASTEGGKLEPAYSFKIEWADDELPITEKRKFDREINASPLFADGLIYHLIVGGGLVVSDAASGEMVYRKLLPMKPRTEYWGWGGASASPALAGKYIYLMDNQGGSVVIEPGKVYKEVAVNRLEELRDGKEQVQCLSTPVFDGTRMYYRMPGYLYCIGTP